MLFTKDNKQKEILAGVMLVNKNLEDIAMILADIKIETVRNKNAYDDFINVIQNFFAIEKKLRIQDAARKEAKEAEFEETKADKKY